MPLSLKNKVAFFELSSNPCCILDTDGKFLELNASWEKLTGFRIEELKDQSAVPHIHKEDTKPFLLFLTQLQEGLSQQPFKGRFHKKNDEYIHLEWNASYCHSTEHIYVNLRDVSSEINNERLLSYACEIAKIGSWIVDVQEKKSTLSPEVYHIMGLDPNQDLAFGEGKKFFIGKHQDTVERCMQRAIEYGEPWDEELQIQTSQGQRKWVRSVGRPVYRHNEVVALQGVFQDINEQVAGRLTKKEISKDYLQELEKEIETKNKELEQSHAKYLALYENSPEMQVSVDPNTGLILSCNKTLVKKLGYSSKEYVIGKPILSVYSQESVEDAKACLAQFKKHGFVKSQELKVLGNLEEPLDVLLNVNAIKDQNGNIVSSQSVWTDITERNAMLKRLKNKRLLLDVMTELNTDGWWDWDLTQPENEYMSPGFKKLFGYEDHEVPNQSSWWQEHIFPEDKQLAIQAFEDHVEHGKPYHVNVRYRHKNGSTIWVLCRGYAIRDEKGTPIRMLGTHTDITTLKNLQIELEKSNRELSQFAYVASHDLRAPLRHIASYSEFIKEKFWKNDDQESLQWFKYIDSGITHMRALIDSLLSFSRVGREGLNKTNVDMVKACEKLDRILNAPLNECGGEIEWENLCQVQADEMIITRVLQNLIENSIKFRCPDRPLKIHIRCEEADRQWKFFIRDNGIGIQKEFHEKIFDLFQKLHSKDQYEGVGMGLAICKKSIELHGGEIHIEEPQDKIGILIHFTLPK